ncbi:hypothetical protein D3C71_74500 [compost metagenome]
MVNNTTSYLNTIPIGYLGLSGSKIKAVWYDFNQTGCKRNVIILFLNINNANQLLTNDG